jgi:hypothetical protein
MKKIKLTTILLPILLVGCTNSSDDVYLTCNGYSEIINVYGKNVEEKKEPSIYPVQIKRKNTGIFDYFKEPIYEVTVGNVFFQTEDIFSDKTILLGQKDKQSRKDRTIDQTFHLNRNTNHLIFKDTFYQSKTSKQLNQQYSVNFEGKCEKVKDRI